MRIYNTQQKEKLRNMNIIEIREKVRSTYNSGDLTYTGYYTAKWNTKTKSIELKFVKTEITKVQGVNVEEFVHAYVSKLNLKDLCHLVFDLGLFDPDFFSMDLAHGKIGIEDEFKRLVLVSERTKNFPDYLNWAQNELDNHMEFQTVGVIQDILKLSTEKNVKVEFSY